jgi:hypothetical protein
MRLATRETGSRVAGLGAGCIAAVQPTFVFWTTYVLSETVFLLLIAVAADWALLAPRSRRPLLAGALVGALGLLTIAARPTGAPFALAVLLTLIVVAWPRPDRLRAVVVGFLAPCVLLVGIGLASVLALGAALPPIGPTAARVADWAASGIKNGLLETDQGRGTSGVDLDVSPPPIVDSLPLEQRPEFLQDGPLAFATHHPEFVVQQTVRKVRLFWSPVLPQYSLAHALGASVYFSMLYALAALGAAHAQRSKDLVVLCAGCIILFTLTSLVTIVDYDQRYRLPVELFLIPLAAIGLGWLRERWPLVPVPTRRRSGRRTTVEPLAQ